MAPVVGGMCFPSRSCDLLSPGQLPSLFLFLLGLFMWLNFRSIDVMYIYWPVVLIGLTTVILFLPYRLLYHRARKWWAFSNVCNPLPLPAFSF